ncbi:MAG: UDP-N-acetylglucosamine 2-epimerase (non-hydrolyzing) [Alphaproteobacteria bacterium]|nr:UDP-N-acetylglucosamine 2-epimerase (non-hydrolyzing) [Alphaproteobacteria bacterium]
MTKKIVTILGARPQFIKASIVSHVIRQTAGLIEVILHTGQHYDANMSNVFFTELGMRPLAYSLGIGGGSHGEMTGRMLAEIEKILLDEDPDAVLVYGDTNSTLAGALAATKLHIPVAHVEAGLRSFNMKMPEEINRILTDRVSRWLFTPTEAARTHLQREGMPDAQIVPVGDVMFDAALHYGARVKAEGGVLQRLGFAPKSYMLATIHRAENTDDQQRLTAIANALMTTASKLQVVWPLHPRTQAVLQSFGLFDMLAKSITLIDPVGYLDMVQLEKYATVIATDSGGVQKEAFFHQVPCVTLRDETEWLELLEAGWGRLVSPASAVAITTAIDAAVGGKGRLIQPYGEGHASRLIVDRLLTDLVS